MHFVLVNRSSTALSGGVPSRLKLSDLKIISAKKGERKCLVKKYYAAKQEVRAEGVKGALDVLHEENKDLRHKIGIIAGLLIMFFGAFLICAGLWSNDIIEKNRALQVQISALQTVIPAPVFAPTMTPTTEEVIGRASSEWAIRKEAERLATATPTPAPVFYDIETPEYLIRNTGTGADRFDVTMRYRVAPGGVFEKREAGLRLWGFFDGMLVACNTSGRNFHYHRGEDYFQMDSYSGDRPITSECWRYLDAMISK